MSKELILILGGARSGKSGLGEQLARAAERVLFVATAEPLDAEMELRIANHRQQRPSTWKTLEEPRDLTSAIPKALDGYDVCLLDCLTLWVSNLLLSLERCRDAEARILSEVERLLEVCEESSATWVMVTNEVGLGIVPDSRLGREYRDILGRVNQAVASRADRVYFTVAGFGLDIKSLGIPIDCIALCNDSANEEGC